jgi:hypothetical protein
LRRQIEPRHVYLRFAEQAETARIDTLLCQIPDGFHRDAPGGVRCRIFKADVRIQPDAATAGMSGATSDRPSRAARPLDTAYQRRRQP